MRHRCYAASSPEGVQQTCRRLGVVVLRANANATECPLGARSGQPEAALQAQVHQTQQHRELVRRREPTFVQQGEDLLGEADSTTILDRSRHSD